MSDQIVIDKSEMVRLTLAQIHVERYQTHLVPDLQQHVHALSVTRFGAWSTLSRATECVVNPDTTGIGNRHE